MKIDPRCNGCKKAPDELEEYMPGTPEQCEEGERAWAGDDFESPADYVSKEEGTYNPENGHFLCSPCYIAAGMPSAPGGWVAP